MTVPSSPADVDAQGEDEGAEPAKPANEHAEATDADEDQDDGAEPTRKPSPLTFSSEDEDQGSVSQPEGHKNPHETRSRSKQPGPERPESKQRPKSKGKRPATENAEGAEDDHEPQAPPPRRRRGKGSRTEGPETIPEDAELAVVPKPSKLKRKADAEVDPEESDEPVKKKSKQAGGGKGRGWRWGCGCWPRSRGCCWKIAAPALYSHSATSADLLDSGGDLAPSFYMYIDLIARGCSSFGRVPHNNIFCCVYIV